MKKQLGDIAPDFEFVDRNGNGKNFHSVPGKKIVFFFPKAFTPGCTMESCSIRDNYEDLKQNGISEIFGISTDSHEKQESFAEKYNLNFLLVEDQSRKISESYGVLLHAIILNMSRRYTFVVDDENKIIKVSNIGMAGNNTKYGLKNYGKELLELTLNR